MKNFDYLFLILGILFSLVPMYSKVGWIYLCTIYPDLSLAETGRLYNAKILFNLFDGNYTDSVFIIVCGFISCGLLYLSYII